MNKKLYIIFLIFTGFVLNIFFYIFSDNYRYFLQSLKYDNIDYKADDQFKIKLNRIVETRDNKNDLFSGLQNNFDEKVTEKIKSDYNNKENIIKSEQKSNINSDNKKENNVEFINKREGLKLSLVEKNILKKFEKYKLKKVELHQRLFDLTGEYPDEYFEYKAKNITFYFFGNKLYSDLKDIFEVLSYELPFEIKEVNNFGNKSFYINLKDGFQDEYIRLVVQSKSRTFGIKIQKDLYEKIKTNLYQVFK